MFTDKKFIADKIRTFRKYSGLTQAELAEKIGISDKHVCRIENAAFTPSLETFLKIASVLNIGLNEFGVEIQPSENQKRDKCVKFFYSISDEEIEFYYNVLMSLEKNLYLLKK